MNFGPLTASNFYPLHVNSAIYFIAWLRRRRSANGTQPNFAKQWTVHRDSNMPCSKVGSSLRKKIWGQKLLHSFGFPTTSRLIGEYLQNKMWHRARAFKSPKDLLHCRKISCNWGPKNFYICSVIQWLRDLMANICWKKCDTDNRARALEGTKAVLRGLKNSWTLVHKGLKTRPLFLPALTVLFCSSNHTPLCGINVVPHRDSKWNGISSSAAQIWSSKRC